MRILHLTSVHNPLDTRIFLKECITLKNNGFDVCIIAPYERDDCIEGIGIKHVRYPKNRFVRITKTVFDVYKTAKKERADLYHFHDPELIIIGTFLKLHGKKVIYDIHEDVPNQILEKEWINPFILRKTISICMKLVEKFTGRIFNAIVTVTPDIAQRFPSSKTILLRNYVSLKYIDGINSTSIKKIKPVIIYHGTISKSHGIREIIQAVGLLQGKAELWIFGSWDDKELWSECIKLKGWQNTQYYGKKKITDIYSYLKLADVGLHILYNLPHFKGGFATKVFEFMACSIPFVVSDNPRNRKNYEGCCLFVNPMDPNDIAEKISKCLNDDMLRDEMGRKGRYLAETMYSWEKESEKLVTIYDLILS